MARGSKQEKTEESKSTEAMKSPRRARLNQSDVPSYSLADALRVPEALRDQYGKKATRPLLVAKAIGMAPSTGNFRMITGAAVAYGLTEGAAQADTIGLTELGRRAVAPMIEGDDLRAKRDAVLQPRVVREFLLKYDGSRVPLPHIAANVLEDIGVPANATERAFNMIIKNAEDVGFLLDNGGKLYVNLKGSEDAPAQPTDVLNSGDPDETGHAEPEGLTPVELAGASGAPNASITGIPASAGTDTAARNRRVFVTHGRNRQIVDQLKELLMFGKFEPIVSVDREATAVPLPDKVMNDMRSCGAGIVHVGAELTLLDSEGKEHKVLNSNVLIEIGAALALFGRNFILLVEKGTQLPSNLQGLYEVRYDGDKLDYEATMKLLRAFNQFTSLERET
jgi:hypothetical protein